MTTRSYPNLRWYKTVPQTVFLFILSSSKRITSHWNYSYLTNLGFLSILWCLYFLFLEWIRNHRLYNNSTTSSSFSKLQISVLSGFKICIQATHYYNLCLLWFLSSLRWGQIPSSLQQADWIYGWARFGTVLRLLLFLDWTWLKLHRLVPLIAIGMDPKITRIDLRRNDGPRLSRILRR